MRDEQKTKLPALPTASVSAVPDICQRWTCWTEQLEPETRTWTRTPGGKGTFCCWASFYLNSVPCRAEWWQTSLIHLRLESLESLESLAPVKRKLMMKSQPTSGEGEADEEETYSNSLSASGPQLSVPNITAIYCGGKPFTAIFFQIINQLCMFVVLCPQSYMALLTLRFNSIPSVVLTLLSQWVGNVFSSSIYRALPACFSVVA